MTPTRRRTLRALGATVAGTALAGCLSDDEPTNEDGNGGDSGVSVQDVTATPAVVTLNSPDSYGTYGDRNEQLIIADITVESPDDHPVSSFAVEAGGERYEVTTDIYRGFELETFGKAYEPASDGPTPSASASEDGETGPSSGWIAAYVPKPLDADSARLTWDGGEHAVDDAVLELLNRPPATFDVTFEAPDSATVGETVTATVTVGNTADVDGTFVGAINRVGPRIAYAPETEVRLDIEAGENADWEYTHSLDSSELEEMEDPSMELHLVWRDGSPVRTVDIESE
ncbi:hypothetical protein [Natronomonas gomsonensis]|uniref:hypothetical protein n=1 Tax=Natronomonas gomsonensis TaxID=1046043 RepID=UPI0015C068D8|nr:hypothetical protein [Natronomonas gomsonensis]